ncbi:MAG: hypothetical protein Pg6A_02490 [Termitinemataceae bacterium]|nr:MAG: hypothetical protein Pg6A_02490 [Termitinemataceae bacterium]
MALVSFKRGAQAQFDAAAKTPILYILPQVQADFS